MACYGPAEAPGMRVSALREPFSSNIHQGSNAPFPLFKVALSLSVCAELDWCLKRTCWNPVYSGFLRCALHVKKGAMEMVSLCESLS